MIDLRSDTVTKPSPTMLKAMLNAKVGDDVYGEDPTINELQEYVANLLNKEAALFVPTGTMSNQLCLKVLTKPGDEILIEKDAHIFYFETAAPSIISNIQLRQIGSTNGEMPLEEIEDSIRPDVYYLPKTACICLENTHNRHGGTIISLEYINKISNIAKKHNLALHLDGARIWNASIATGIKLDKYVSNFDTVSVCLSKGLGAPVGSLLASTKENIKIAHKWRKILGGGMRQAGYLAAAGLFALKNNLSRLSEDHQNAKKFAELLKDSDLNVNSHNIHTNMVVIETNKCLSAKELALGCEKSGVLFNPISKNKARIVFHLDINEEETKNAANIIKSIAHKLTK